MDFDGTPRTSTRERKSPTQYEASPGKNPNYVASGKRSAEVRAQASKTKDNAVDRANGRARFWQKMYYSAIRESMKYASLSDRLASKLEVDSRSEYEANPKKNKYGAVPKRFYDKNVNQDKVNAFTNTIMDVGSPDDVVGLFEDAHFAEDNDETAETILANMNYDDEEAGIYEHEEDVMDEGI